MFAREIFARDVLSNMLLLELEKITYSRAKFSRARHFSESYFPRVNLELKTTLGAFEIAKLPDVLVRGRVCEPSGAFD